MPQLDGLRAVAVGLVILSHWTGLKILSPGGHIGVQIFFVLSGFLISGILLVARDAAASAQRNRFGVFRAFYIRRFLRIFPAYYAVLAVAFIVGIPPVRESIYWHVLYLSNFYVAYTGEWLGYVGHFWSLAVEEQFYLVWPFVVLLFPKNKLHKLIVGLILFSIGFRYMIGPAIGLSSIAIYVSPFSSLDSLMVGAWLALRVNSSAESGIKAPQALSSKWIVIFFAVYTGLAILNSAPVVEKYSSILGPIERTFFLMGALVLVARASSGINGPVGQFLQSAALVFVGKISYGIYLMHNFTPYILENILIKTGIGSFDKLPRFIEFTVNLLFLVVIASLSWFLFEKRINSIKKYFPYSGEVRLQTHKSTLK
ncbi:acyltransferase family protein [Pseudomonadota bacterium]